VLAGHAVPQPPQLFTSVEVSLHMSPHSTWPDGQEVWQVPLTQVCPEGQVVPQPPQLSVSLPVSTQVPAHNT
jgi:hypothetical protein